MTPMECMSYLHFFLRGQDKNFPRTYTDDQTQLVDIWYKHHENFKLEFRSALQLQFPGNLNAFAKVI